MDGTGPRLKLFVSPKAVRATRFARLTALLRRAAPTWLSTPQRRLIQSLFLGLYLVLFFYVCWPYAEAFSAQLFASKEFLPAEALLWIDPLVGLSTAVAARAWNVALWGMLLILLIGFIIPRGFCSYICPLGTLIDAFDFAVKRLLGKRRQAPVRAWANLRFYLLAGIVFASVCGVLLSGFFSAIPVLTRGLLFSAGFVQLGLLKNWAMVPPVTIGVIVSLALFGAIFTLSLFRPRFWCRYVCPSGALLSLPALGQLSHRKVSNDCTSCGKCIEACPFDAINGDYSTRSLNCSFCQSCAGVCPVEAISFPLRQEHHQEATAPTAQPLTRRAMLASSIGGAACALGVGAAGHSKIPVRPPGSVPENAFLDLCIRCGECIKVCPGPVLQAAGGEYGMESLWTPVACFSHAGCHQECNSCTQVCPTQAIRPLALSAKRQFHIGLAEILPNVCLPHRGERDCQLCFEECTAAGYNAIEMRPIAMAIGDVPEGAVSASELEEMSRIQAPFIKPELCVGCGLCEYRCHAANVRQRKLTTSTAVLVRAT